MSIKTIGCEARKNIALNFTPADQGTQTLYWRGKTWYVAFRLPGEPLHRISLKTDKVSVAKNKAQHEFVQIQARLQSGKPLREITFQDVGIKLVNKLNKELEERRKYGRHNVSGEKLRHEQTLIKKIAYVEKYMIPFFKDKKITSITDNDISELKRFYATYWTDGPGKNIVEYSVIKNGKPLKIKRRELGTASRNTLNNFVMCLNELLKLAKAEYNTETKIRKTSYVDADINARTSFTQEQCERLIATQEERITAEKRQYHKLRLRRVIWLIEFARWSGLRPAELKNLKWGQIEIIDIPNGKTLQIKNVSSKDKKPRTVFCLAKIMKAYDEFYKHINRVPHPDEYVFCSDRSKFKPCKLVDGFQVLAQKADLWLDEKGKYRTLGSLRHSYAQYMIHNMDPFNLFKLATNMGTSEKQIRNHYAADINMREDIAALSGTPDIGLVGTIFERAKQNYVPAEQDEYTSDAMEFIRIMDDEYGEWREFDDKRLISEIKNIFDDDFNSVEREQLLKIVRKMFGRS